MSKPNEPAPSLRQILDDAELEGAVESALQHPSFGSKVEDYAPKEEDESEVSRFFVASGEVIAKALEEQAEKLDKLARDYRRLAENTREVAEKQAREAFAHEAKQKQISDLLGNR